MTDFFSFARLNLLNVLICTAKKNFDSDFPSLLKQSSFFAPGPSGDSRETRFIHEWRFIHAKRHAGSKEVRLLSQATIFLPRVLMYQTFWWSTKPRGQKQETGNYCDVISGLQTLEFEIVTYFVTLVVLCDKNTYSRNLHLAIGNDTRVNRSKPKLNYPAHFDRLESRRSGKWYSTQKSL